MALLWCDGFDSYGAAAGAPNGIASKYHQEFESDSLMQTGRDPGYLCLEVDTPGKLFTPHLTTNATTIAGFALKLNNLSVDSRTILSFKIPSLDGSTIGYRCMELMTTGNTDLYVNFNGTNIGSTTNLGLTANTWYYCEMKVFTSTTVGTVEVRINGNAVINVSGVNTRFSATYPFYSSIGFIGETGQLISVDDFYVCDGSGSTNNDFLGQCIVRDSYPTGDASGNWTANSAGTKYEEVDDGVTRDNNSYIYTTTANAEQVFETSNVTLSGNIYGAMVSVDMWGTGNFPKAVKTLTQQGSGTLNVDSITHVPAISANLTATRIQELDPDGNTWNQTRLNTLRVGVRAV